MKRHLATSLLAMCLPFLAGRASACSTAICLDRGIEMRPDFVLKITHADKPLPGAVVEIRGPQDGSSGEKLSVKTGKDGVVRVTNLAPGDYWANAEFLGISAAYFCFHVADSPSRKAKHALKFEWGDLAPATRRIAGKLVDSQPGKGGTPFWNMLHRNDVPIASARLELRNATTNDKYTAASDANGTFAFDGIPSGTYVLHIDAGKVPPDREYEATDLLVALDASARRNSLLLRRSEPYDGSCGGTSLELEDTSKQESAAPVSK